MIKTLKVDWVQYKPVRMVRLNGKMCEVDFNFELKKLMVGQTYTFELSDGWKESYMIHNIMEDKDDSKEKD